MPLNLDPSDIKHRVAIKLVNMIEEAGGEVFDQYQEVGCIDENGDPHNNTYSDSAYHMTDTNILVTPKSGEENLFDYSVITSSDVVLVFPKSDIKIVIEPSWITVYHMHFGSSYDEDNESESSDSDDGSESEYFCTEIIDSALCDLDYSEIVNAVVEHMHER